MNRVERFWAKVERADGCWRWTGATSKGRGRFGWDGFSKLAARVSYELANPGVDTSGKLIRHVCDNPICVRPDHLVIGTQTDNMRDAKERGRTARGERHGRRKLTELDVLSLRHDRAGGASLQAIARTYGISPAAVSMIARGLQWTDVGGPITARDPRWHGKDEEQR